MTPYFLVAAAAVAGAYLSSRVELRDPPLAPRWRAQRLRAPRRWNYFDIAVATIFVAFSGLRFRVGTDYAVYAAMFEKLRPNDWTRFSSAPLEVGYTALILPLKYVTTAPAAFFWAAAVLTVVPAYVAIKRLSRDLPLSVALYALLSSYFAPFNVVRQGIAVSFVFLGSTYLPKNWRKAAIMAAIGAAFHTSAIFAVAIYAALYIWKPSRRQVLWAASILTPVAFLALRLPALVALLSGINPRYGAYLRGGRTGLGAYLMIIALVGLWAYAGIVGRSAREDVLDERWQFALIVVGIAFMIVGTQAVIVSRMGMYFTIFLVILLPNRIREAPRARFHAGALVVLSALYAYMYLGSYGGLLPYRTYL